MPTTHDHHEVTTRKRVGTTLTAPKYETNSNVAYFSQIRKSFKFRTFLGICEKLLTKSEGFEIRKVFSEGLFISKIFKIKFQS